MKRRAFIQATTGIAASTGLPQFAIGKPGKSANGKLNIAFIGSGGWIAQQPYNQGCSEENLVAFCDVDRNHCAENMKNWQTNQPFFEDFRVMLDKLHKQIDAVVVSTPDHTHFAATLAAMIGLMDRKTGPKSAASKNLGRNTRRISDARVGWWAPRECQAAARMLVRR